MKKVGHVGGNRCRGRLKGVFTDGDLRRLFQERDSFAGLKVDDIMHASPKTISADRLATEALKAMQSGHVNGLLVVEEKRRTDWRAKHARFIDGTNCLNLRQKRFQTALC